MAKQSKTAEPLRYAVVGLGRAGWGIHVVGLRDRTDAKIVAVVDPLAERRQQAKEELGARGYTTLPELLADCADVDVVVIATPSVDHGPDTIAALKAGKHVVVEKPMSMNVAEARGMIAAAKKAGRQLFVHQNYRFFRNYTFLEDVVKSKVLGPLHLIRCCGNGFARRNDWQTLARNGGGVLNNTCPHFIDQIVQLVGAPITQVMGDLQQIASAGDVEDHVKALMRAANGCCVDLEFSTAINNAADVPQWVIAGKYGTLTVWRDRAVLRTYDPRQVKKLKVVDGAAAARKYGNDDKLPWEEKTFTEVKGTDHGNFYDNVFAVLRNKKKMRVTPDSVLEVMRVIGMIRKGTAFTGEVAKPKAKPAKKAAKRK